MATDKFMCTTCRRSFEFSQLTMDIPGKAGIRTSNADPVELVPMILTCNECATEVLSSTN